MGMDRARSAQCETGVVRSVYGAKNFHKVQHGAEMARLELEGAAQVVQALLVPSQQVIKHSALVPGLGEIGNAAQEQRESGLGDVVAPRGEVAGGEVEDARGSAMRVVHPDVPDALFGRFGIGARAARQAAEQLVEEGRSVDRPPRAVAANQPKNLNQWPILVEIARRGCERPEQCAVVQ